MPLTPEQQAAQNRLQTYYDGDLPYDPTSNPGGFRRGGNVINFEPALKDVATVLQGAGVLAGDAQAFRDQAGVSALRAETYAAQSVGTPGAPVLGSSYSSTLPKGVTALSSAGVGTGSGGTPGTYTGGVTGGPSGFAWTYTIGSDGKVASYAIANPGLATGTTAPTLSYPSGGLTGATVPVATVASLVAQNKTYWATAPDGLSIGLYTNNGTATPAAVLDGTGRQTRQSTKAATDATFTAVFSALSKPLIFDGYEGDLELSRANGRVVRASGNDVAVLKFRPIEMDDKAAGQAATLSRVDGRLLTGVLRSGGLGSTQMVRQSVAAAASGLGGALRAPRILHGAKAPLILITVGGQSLAVRGGTYVPQVFTSTPPSSDVLMPSVGVSPLGRTFAGCVPAFEQLSSGVGETGFVALANGMRAALSTALGINVTVALVITAAGGTAISSLGAGTTVGEETALNIQRIADYAKSQGRECWHLMDLWIHGNEDTGVLPDHLYLIRQQNRHDHLSHLSATLTQRPASLRFVSYTTQVDAVSSAFEFCRLAGPAAAQLANCMRGRDIRWAGTSYPFDHIDGTHLDSRNYYWYAIQNLGLMLLDYFGEGVQPFAVRKAYWLSDTKLRLEYMVPVPPFVLDETNLICQTFGIAGYKGLQFDNGAGTSSPQPTAITVVDNGSGTVVSGVYGSGEYGKALVDVDFAAGSNARSGPYRRLGIGLGLGTGASAGLGFSAAGRLTTSGGVPQSFIIDAGGTGWGSGTISRACIVSGNAGTYITDAAASGGAITGATLPAATGLNDNPYVAFLRGGVGGVGGAGRSNGARTLFRDSMNFASPLGWDGLFGASLHPRTVTNWAAHQLVEL